MLAAQAEASGPGPFLDLLLRARKDHKRLGEELYETAGLDPEYAWEGMLRIASDEESAKTLRDRYDWQKKAGLSARWLDPEEARELEPAISQEIRAALHLPDEGQVNSPRLVRALAIGAARIGAVVEEATPVTGFSTTGCKITGLETTQGSVSAGTVVLATGAASRDPAHELGISLPVYPVKGQILAVESGIPPIRATVWDNRCYAVPKRDGRVVIGATEEPGVYDRRPTLGGISHLSAAAIKLIPALSHAPFSTAWGGLRPGTPSGEPILGPAEGWENLLLAAGHYRNGVLLSHTTGEIISNLALNEPAGIDISPFLHEKTKKTAARQHAYPKIS